MIPRTHSLPAVCLILLALVASVAVGHAAPSDKKTLLLRGRVTDAETWPIGDVKMVASGDRKASATTDASGQYELKVPIGTPAELARHPISMRVRGTLRGWRITLPGGDPELGIELRVVAGDDGVVRCEIQSNQAKVTSAITRVLTTDGDATGLGAVNFLATRGEAADAGSSLELGATDRVALAGLAVTAIPSSEPPRPKREKPVREERAQAPVAAAPPAATPAAPKPRKQAAERKAKLSPNDAPATALEVAHEEPKVDAAAEARRLREEKRERERLDKIAKDAEKDRLRREAKDRKSVARASEEELKKDRAAHQARWNDLQHEVHMIAGASDTTSAPPVTVLESMAGSPRRAENRGHAPPRRTVLASSDTVRVRPPRALPEPPPTPAPLQRTLAGVTTAKPYAPPEPSDAGGATATLSTTPPRPWLAEPAPTPARSARPNTAAADPPATRSNAKAADPPPARSNAKAADPPPARSSTTAIDPRASRSNAPATDPPATRSNAAPAEPSRATAADRTRSPRIVPEPEGEGRTRARPLVIRSSATADDATDGDGDPCGCRIEGTVEVRSDQPLPSRQRVVVSLVWYPALADTVELFMGSPRAFLVSHAPCGPQRLKITSLGSMRFDVISREAMAGFRCEAGSIFQQRLVLAPR